MKNTRQRHAHARCASAPAASAGMDFLVLRRHQVVNLAAFWAQIVNETGERESCSYSCGERSAVPSLTMSTSSEDRIMM
jgi:hypothetical protein